MRLLLSTFAVAFISVSEAASFLLANQPCGNDKECENQCAKGIFHTAVTGNSTYFACTIDGNSVYTLGACGDPNGNEKSRITQSQKNSVCQAVSGQICGKGAGCIFLQSEVDAFTKECHRIWGSSIKHQNLSYKQATSACPVA